MSILDCVAGKGLNKTIMANLEDLYADLLAKYGDSAAADAALVRVVTSQSATVRKSRIMNALKLDGVEKEVSKELARQKRAFDGLPEWQKKLRRGLQQDPQWHRVYKEATYKRIDNTAHGIFEHMLQDMPSFMQIARDRGLRKDIDVTETLLRGLMDGPDVSTDATVRNAIVELRKAFDWEKKELNRVGLFVGDLEDPYVPVVHVPEKIVNNKGEWKTAIAEATDESKVWDFKTYSKGISPERLSEVHDIVYDTMERGAAAKADRLLQRGMVVNTPPGYSDLFARRHTYRVFHPKNSDAYVSYLQKYGPGMDNVVEMLMAHFNATSRDLATGTVIGPRPNSFHHHMRTMAIAKGATDNQLKLLDGEFKTALNQWDDTIDGVLAKSVMTIQRLNSAALLGGAGFAALSDQAFVGNTARLFKWADADGRMIAFFNSMSKQDALQGVHLVEHYTRHLSQRLDSTLDLGVSGKLDNFSAGAKDLTHKLSGLDWMTTKAADQTSLMMGSYLGRLVKDQADWASLEGMQKLLFRTGINERDWKKVLERGVVDEAGFLRPDAFPDELSDVAVKLRALNAEARGYATNAPDVTMRAVTSGRAFGPRARGDVIHLFSSSFGQFKSFPTMVWRNHFIPSLMAALEGNMSPVAVTAMEALALGAIVVQMKEVAKGNQPKPMDNPAFWVKSGMQGGFYGMMGDILLKDPRHFHRNLISELAGPAPGTIADTANLAVTQAWNIMDGEGWDQPAFTRTIRQVVPLQNLWYARAAVDRMLWDSLNVMVDPTYYETMARRQKEMTQEQGEPWLQLPTVQQAVR